MANNGRNKVVSTTPTAAGGGGTSGRQYHGHHRRNKAPCRSLCCKLVLLSACTVPVAIFTSFLFHFFSLDNMLRRHSEPFSQLVHTDTMSFLDFAQGDGAPSAGEQAPDALIESLKQCRALAKGHRRKELQLKEDINKLLLRVAEFEARLNERFPSTQPPPGAVGPLLFDTTTTSPGRPVFVPAASEVGTQSSIASTPPIGNTTTRVGGASALAHSDAAGLSDESRAALVREESRLFASARDTDPTEQRTVHVLGAVDVGTTGSKLNLQQVSSKDHEGEDEDAEDGFLDASFVSATSLRRTVSDPSLYRREGLLDGTPLTDAGGEATLSSCLRQTDTERGNGSGG
ncbi:unnamed protein product [Amoebophrya sp. A25]|nr:unnamed protein product [Amoebophrya sp. A25]|eukprot:GSA25T00020232001.1